MAQERQDDWCLTTIVEMKMKRRRQMDWEDILEGKRADLTDRLNMGIREEGVKGFA